MKLREAEAGPSDFILHYCQSAPMILLDSRHATRPCVTSALTAKARDKLHYATHRIQVHATPIARPIVIVRSVTLSVIHDLSVTHTHTRAW